MIPKGTSVPVALAGGLFIAALGVNITVALTASSDYQKALQDDLILSGMPLIMSIFASAFLCDTPKKSFNSITGYYFALLVTILFAVAAGLFMYRIYNDWFDEPATISGKLISVEAHFDGGSHKRPNKYNLVFRLNNSDKQWSTKSIFTEDEMPQYLEAFSECVGQNLTISYSPSYLTLITVRNEAGQSLFPP